MSNLRPADPLGYTAAHEWRPAFTVPAHPGRYERRTALSIVVDVWDGRLWRRHSATGIACANQALPWRAAP